MTQNGAQFQWLYHPGDNININNDYSIFFLIEYLNQKIKKKKIYLKFW
jgi:hypothetical protein